ncbi:hypothetical protein VTK26DRAFT_337 [Humicola hyalothermophila]
MRRGALNAKGCVPPWHRATAVLAMNDGIQNRTDGSFWKDISDYIKGSSSRSVRYPQTNLSTRRSISLHSLITLVRQLASVWYSLNKMQLLRTISTLAIAGIAAAAPSALSGLDPRQPAPWTIHGYNDPECVGKALWTFRGYSDTCMNVDAFAASVKVVLTRDAEFEFFDSQSCAVQPRKITDGNTAGVVGATAFGADNKRLVNRAVTTRCLNQPTWAFRVRQVN